MKNVRRVDFFTFIVIKGKHNSSFRNLLDLARNRNMYIYIERDVQTKRFIDNLIISTRVYCDIRSQQKQQSR